MRAPEGVFGARVGEEGVPGAAGRVAELAFVWFPQNPGQRGGSDRKGGSASRAGLEPGLAAARNREDAVLRPRPAQPERGKGRRRRLGAGAASRCQPIDPLGRERRKLR